ncbi:probable G-protein coupled receptor 150 [Xenopus laevis]|uniref:G-protein coupled receptors family 1 profile domain-containing protein n=2 Tax=Xenopus laevis TaxID=8355 RepID=A0A974E2U9_XENLA|nr:probable G-protein coupled receptor 150 [Xenopus laevis]OCU02301.1 hypothetical protein XELAEV_18008063mg [Xenopus laevis]
MDDLLLYGMTSTERTSSATESDLSPGHAPTTINSVQHSQAADSPHYNRQLRLITMSIIFAVGLVGNVAVLYKICSGKGKKRKINFLITQLALADLYVSVMSLLSQIVWELLEDEWLVGDIGCRVFKVFQVSGLMASSNIIAIVALERHHVIMNPLSTPLPTRSMAAFGWMFAFLLSVPQAFVFKVAYTGQGNRCLNIFGQLPKWHLQAYIIYCSLIVFFLPFCILCVAYSRILWLIWRRGKVGKTSRHHNGTCQVQESHTEFKRRSLRLTSTNSCIPRAKLKTLKMTLVIIILFIVCGLPYFIVEMKVAFATITGLDEKVMAVLGIFVVTNSAVNPYVYLFFKTNNVFLRRLEKKVCFSCCLKEHREITFPRELSPPRSVTPKKEPPSTSMSEMDVSSSAQRRSLSHEQTVAQGDKGTDSVYESRM